MSMQDGKKQSGYQDEQRAHRRKWVQNRYPVLHDGRE
jgi:hypothetical protein